MDTPSLAAILSRRSIRKYTDRAVAEELVIELLRAAMAAPSAGNQQPWEFIVVRDRDLLESISRSQPYAGMTRDAQVAIVICADVTREKHPGFWVEDCAAATENLLLAAHMAGLGAVWLGYHPVEDRVAVIRKLFGLPETIVPFAVVPIGYPAEQPSPADRFDPARVHYERW
jgi:nitroreductase